MTSGPGPAEGMLPFAAEVAAYLTDCAVSRPRLDPAYHPTEEGAVKLIFHRRHHDPAADQAAEAQIRRAFRMLTAAPGGRAPGPVRRERQGGPRFHLPHLG